ncbi:EAL domain-containing protein [Paracoccus ravus]|uniref:EAL domain-containing protein n=1 Tax=Paracoccus ravus TaxID=2447760 RepID=UPI00106DF924|nr:EAL domain-containing protein [Paracoccus ravus]
MAGIWKAATLPGRRASGRGLHEPISARASAAFLFHPQICCDSGRIAAFRLSATGRSGVDHGSALRETLQYGLAALRGWDGLGAVSFLSIALPEQALCDPLLAEDVLWEIDRQELAPDRLEIEVIDPHLRGTARETATRTMCRLAMSGCRIALGDFGIAGVGLEELRRVQARRMRVGRRFLAGCDSRVAQQRMILAILALAEHLGLETLGDGVETSEERGFLSQIGFTALQGPAVGAPLTSCEVERLLLDQLRGAAWPGARSQCRDVTTPSQSAKQLPQCRAMANFP